MAANCDSASARLVRTPTWLVVGVLAVATALAYVAWLGWDQEYQYDPVTDAQTGPYRAWQVVGCGLTLTGLTIAAGLARRPGAALAVVPTVFTVAWSSQASSDDSGLWLVGATTLLLGSLASVAGVAYFVDATSRSRAGARGPRSGQKVMPGPP